MKFERPPMSRFVYPILSLLIMAPFEPAASQQLPSAPSVGVIKVERKPITEATEFIGRIQAVERVNLSARVTAFLVRRQFVEGSEVKQGALLYQLERDPFEADVQAKEALITQIEAQLKNASLSLSRARQLLATSAGTQASADTAEANQQALVGQLLAAQAQLRQSHINLAYTEIRAPIDGKVSQTTVTPGNVVSPSFGVLTTIVSQDPMYVVFSVPVRTALELRQRIDRESFDVVRVKIKLPDGRLYDQTGKLDFLNNTISANTDTLQLRATIANPAQGVAAEEAAVSGVNRELVDGEFVTILLEGARPIEALTVPRTAVLSDQTGDYVYVVNAEGKAEQRRLKIGQSTPTTAVILSGLDEGQMVIVEGLQRIRPGQPVAPGPAANSADNEKQDKDADFHAFGGSTSTRAKSAGRG
jgi:membrane fusion protein (multidrug efflux system)